MKRRAVQCPQVARLPTRATTAVFDGFTLRVPLADDAAHLASHGVWGKGTHSRSAPRLARDLKKAKAKRDSKLRRPNHEIEYGKEQLQLLYEEAFFLAQRGLLDVRRAQAEDAVDISPDVAPARPSSAGASKTHKTAAAAPPGAPAAAGGEAGEPAPCSGGAGAGAVTSSAAAGASDPAGAAQQLSPAERKALRLQRSRRRAELRWKMPHRPERAAVGPVLSVQDLWTVFCARKPDFPSRFAVYSYCRTRNWIVRSGTSNAVDFILYKYGPEVDHAESCIVITPLRREQQTGAPGGVPAALHGPLRVNDWFDLQAHSRVSGFVVKAFVMCEVSVADDGGGDTVDISTPACIDRLSIAEMQFHRRLGMNPSDEREEFAATRLLHRSMTQLDASEVERARAAWEESRSRQHRVKATADSAGGERTGEHAPASQQPWLAECPSWLSPAPQLSSTGDAVDAGGEADEASDDVEPGDASRRQARSRSSGSTKEHEGAVSARGSARSTTRAQAARKTRSKRGDAAASTEASAQDEAQASPGARRYPRRRTANPYARARSADLPAAKRTRQGR